MDSTAFILLVSKSLHRAIGFLDAHSIIRWRKNPLKKTNMCKFPNMYWGLKARVQELGLAFIYSSLVSFSSLPIVQRLASFVGGVRSGSQLAPSPLIGLALLLKFKPTFWFRRKFIWQEVYFLLLTGCHICTKFQLWPFVYTTAPTYRNTLQCDGIASPIVTDPCIQHHQRSIGCGYLSLYDGGGGDGGENTVHWM